MKVWFIRHGESETNKAGLWTGWLDVELTEKGREEALAVSRTLSGVRFDKIYSSDLKRAMTTADIAIPGCSYEATPMVREINVGNIAGKPLSAIIDSNGQPMNLDGYGTFGGETLSQFKERVKAFMRSLEAERHENIAVFTHWGVIKTFLETVLGTRLPTGKLRGGNCLVAVFEYSGSNWSLHSWINLH